MILAGAPGRPIYAVGDVIGFPALAAASMPAISTPRSHAFGQPTARTLELQPIGIDSIPEVPYVGATEVELTNDSIAYEVGVSHYRELARGQSPASQTASVRPPTTSSCWGCMPSVPT
jgi:pyruvate/2-oxoglutarate dehydrogenase complex dihydrolipoamide dehydrogenase (E3) component